MRLAIDLSKTVEQNAAVYYEKAKKAKKKIDGAMEAVRKAKQKMEQARKKALAEEKREETIVKGKKLWYHNFRWFISSEGFVCVGGRDATTNEIIIKKHAEPNDIVFHTDMAGSPFFVVKAGKKRPGEKTMQEAADATVSFSRAWREGLLTTDVFYVNPEQVTKETKSGEYMPKGAFMIRGKTNYIKNSVNMAVGIAEGNYIMAGPADAVKKNCTKYVEIEPGSEKTSDTAKKIRKVIGGELDEIIRALPSGGCKVKKK